LTLNAYSTAQNRRNGDPDQRRKAELHA
jgi:hypothetical protein